MSLAHKGSILPIKHCVPVDKNTTFLAHYDITEEESLFGIKPIGYRYALEFDGINDYVSVNRMISDDFTIEFWFNSTQGVSSNSGYKWYYGAGMIDAEVSGVTNDFGVSLYSDGTIIAGVGNPDTHVYSSPGYNDGKWHHVAFTRVKSSGLISLYVDGNLIMTATGGTQSLTASTRITIGSLQTSINYFKGKITEVRIWNIVRNQQQIKESMYKELNGNESGLVGYWKLNEGSGTIVYDYTNNKNNGTINGAIWSDGQSVFTLRPFEGKYGGGIAIEEGTENLLATVGGGAAQDWSKWSHWNSSAYWGLTEQYDDPIWGKVFRGTKNGATYPDTYIFDYYPYSYAIGDVYSFSCWMKVNKTMSKSIGFYLNTNIGGQHDVAPIAYKTINFIENQWVKVEFISNAVTETINGAGGFGLKMGAGWDNCIVEIAYPQFEKKPFSTSFVNGKRTAGILKYNADCINPQQGTISFWYKPSYPSSYVTQQNDSPKLIQVGEYYTNSSFTIWNFTNNLRLYVKGATSGSWALATNGLASLNQNIWTMITVTWNNTTWKVYKDGVLLSSFTSSETLGSINGNFLYVGGDGENGGSSKGKVCNGIIDELRIDKVERTAEEILQWYYSQAPFFPKGVHRIYS